MLEFLRRNRILRASLCFLGLAVGLRASTRARRGSDRLRRVLLAVVAPRQRVGMLGARALGDRWLDAAALFRRRADLDALRARVVELEERTVHIDEVELENARLRELLAFRKRL